VTAPVEPSRCPACGTPVTPQARYCEACGHDLAEPAAPASRPRAASHAQTSDADSSTAHGASAAYGVSAPPPPGCASCGNPGVGADGYCESCGARRPAAADHGEVDLGVIAGVSDIGARHHHNEDAMGLATTAGATAAVVCDGVSSSNRPDTAATAGAIAAAEVFAAGLPTLANPPDAPEPASVAPLDATAGNAAAAAAAAAAADTLSAGTDSGETGPGETNADDDAGTREVARTGAIALLQAAATAAQAAAADAGGGNSGPNPPSTTFVAAVVTTTEVAVGWVGDSRAYWLPDPGTPGDPLCLTVDDTLAGQLGAAGVIVSADAPNAAALLRWLGADATDTEPHVASHAPAGPGRVIVCSDGLYRYVPEPAQLAAATPDGRPIEVASALVRLALDAGGQDNVTVAVLPYPPKSTPDVATETPESPTDG
jgi:serine/threonine protein phosphatase PrpC